jgi:organic hydroperoxide reductase OsmC/OhrA
MEMKQHTYSVAVEWTGNDGQGTKTYKSYRRDHRIHAEGKPPIEGSSDPAFRGDASRYNPEDLLVASLSACHMLSYLHLCAVNGITVLEYKDSAHGEMKEAEDGSGVFTHVSLKPTIKIASGGNLDKAATLHHKAHELCFIANSVRFPVEVVPEILEV